MKDGLASQIQNHDLINETFFFINKGFIRLILKKLKEDFYPNNISMDDGGFLMVDNKCAELKDFTKEQIDWFFNMKDKFIGGCQAPLALVGAINRVRKEYEKGDIV